MFRKLAIDTHLGYSNHLLYLCFLQNCFRSFIQTSKPNNKKMWLEDKSLKMVCHYSICQVGLFCYALSLCIWHRCGHWSSYIFGSKFGHLQPSSILCSIASRLSVWIRALFEAHVMGIRFIFDPHDSYLKRYFDIWTIYNRTIENWKNGNYNYSSYLCYFPIVSLS